MQSVALSPDGKVVAAISLQSQLFAWSTESPAVLWRTPLRGGSVGSQHVLFAPNGELLLLLGGRLERRRLFDERGRVVWAFGGQPDTLFGVGGRTGVIAGPDGILRLDVENGQQHTIALDLVALLRGRPGAIRARPMRVALSPSGRMAHVVFHLLAHEGERPSVEALRLVPVDLESRQARESIAIPPAVAEGTRFASLDDGGAVFFGADGSPPRVLEASGSLHPLEDAGRRSERIHAGIATPDGGFLGAGANGGTLWDLATRKIRGENRALVATGPTLALAAGIVASPQINSVALFSATTLSRLGGAAAHGGDVRGVAVSPRGRSVFSSDTHTVRGWHAQTTEPMWEAIGSLLAVSPDATRVAVLVRDSVARARLAVLDAASGDRLDDAEVQWVESACFRDDGVLVTAVRTAMTPAAPVRIAFCEGAELREVGQAQMELGYDLTGCVFAPGASAFLACHRERSETVCVDVPSGAVRWTVAGGLPVPSPDGAFVALTTNGETGIQIVEMATGQPKGHVTLESWRVVAWGAGDLLLAVSGDKNPRALRLPRRELQSETSSVDPTWLELEGGRAMSTGGAFFPDGTRAVMGDERGMLLSWRVDGF